MAKGPRVRCRRLGVLANEARLGGGGCHQLENLVSILSSESASLQGVSSAGTSRLQSQVDFREGTSTSVYKYARVKAVVACLRSSSLTLQN